MNSRADMPGSLRSVRTRSTCSLARMVSAVSASGVENVWKPASPRSSSSRRRMRASSSMMRMLGMVFAGLSAVLGARQSGDWPATAGRRIRGHTFFGRSLRAQGFRVSGQGKEKDEAGAGCSGSQFDRATMLVDDFGDDGKAEADAGLF